VNLLIEVQVAVT